MHNNPSLMYVGAVDRELDELVIYRSFNGGLTWNTYFEPIRVTADDLGITLGAADGFYAAVSPYGYYDGTEYFVDFTFDAGADAGIIGTTQYHTRIEIFGVIPGVKNADDNSAHANGLNLKQNYPNPFNPSTEIRFELASNANTEFTIYNLLGQKIRTLMSGYQSAGLKTVTWDGKNDQGTMVTSGVYIYRIVAKSNDKTFVKSRKMLLIK
jgi:hypothetical protein